MITRPEFGVIVAPGTNCEGETMQALEKYGGVATLLSIADLKSGEAEMDSLQGLVIPGGFSYGDTIRAGAIFANDFRPSRRADGTIDARLTDNINEFAAAGKPIIGTCNGFQVLVELGLLPDGKISEGQRRLFTLDTNKNSKFECRWVNVVIENSACPFIPEEDVGSVLPMAVAHAEGRFRTNDAFNYTKLGAMGQVVMRYCDRAGKPTMSYPGNPNGSPGGIAGICSPKGAVFAMMPHDERLARREHHPNWRRQEVSVPDKFYAKVLRGAINYAKEM